MYAVTSTIIDYATLVDVLVTGIPKYHEWDLALRSKPVFDSGVFDALGSLLCG